ncbi:MAG: hypothetical protein U0457_11595 [Candidatus Sericytochromatia bacterium]
MDITKINRKIFDELSEAEKSRILRFLSEDDTFKLSSTISRYIETNPNFVKSFFSELLQTRYNGALYILFCIIYNFFDEIIKLLGQSLIYDLSKISSFDYRDEYSIVVKVIINNYDKFPENLKEKLIEEIYNNKKCFYYLIEKIKWDLSDKNNIYYKFSPKIRDFILLKSVKKSCVLLSSLYKELNKEIKEKIFDILIQNNKLFLTPDYLITFISINYSEFPEDKKQIFLNKLYEVANKENLAGDGNDLYYNFQHLYKNIPYENFIELL